MDEFENLIEKYRRELVEFSKSNPSAAKDEMTDCENGESALPENENSLRGEIPNSENEAAPETEQGAEYKPEMNEKEIYTQSEGDTSPFSDEKTADDRSVPKFSTYEDFIKNNPQTGSLRFQVYAANQAFPVPSARVTVVLELESETRELFDGLTDINGVIDDIVLPAPDRMMSQSPSDSPALPYSSYTAVVEHPEFAGAKFTDIPVFSGIKSVQGVELIPLVSVGNEPQMTDTQENGAFPRIKGAE